jgi:hypothetical protein
MTKLREEVESLAPGILNLGSGQPHDPLASPPGKKPPVRLEQEVRAGRSEKNLLPLLGIELRSCGGTAHYLVTMALTSAINAVFHKF